MKKRKMVAACAAVAALVLGGCAQMTPPDDFVVGVCNTSSCEALARAPGVPGVAGAKMYSVEQMQDRRECLQTCAPDYREVRRAMCGGGAGIKMPDSNMRLPSNWDTEFADDPGAKLVRRLDPATADPNFGPNVAGVSAKADCSK